MVGLDSWKSSTTVTVRELDITLDELVLRIADYYRKAWKLSVKEAMECAHEEAEELTRLGENFTTGRTLEVRGDTVQVR